MLIKDAIFTLSILCSVSFVQTTQTCEISTCVFNKEYIGQSNVTEIQPPKKEYWISKDQLDQIDKTIFGETTLPYGYENIANASQKKVYVNNETYQPLITKAKEQLHNKKQAITEQLKTIGTDTTKAGDYMKFSLAQNRLEEYEKILTKNDRFRHLCAGIILTKQTKRCIALWAFLNQQ